MKVFCTYCGAANFGDVPVCVACATPLAAPRAAPPVPQAVTMPASPAGYGGQDLPAASPWPTPHDPYANVRQPGPLYPVPPPVPAALPAAIPTAYQDPAFSYPYASPSDPYGQFPDPAQGYPYQYPSVEPYGQAYPPQQRSGLYAAPTLPPQQDPYAVPPYADQGYGFPAPGYPQAPPGYAGSAIAAAPPPYPASAYAQPTYPPAYPSPAYPQLYLPAPGYQQGSASYALAPNGGPGSLASTMPRFGSYLFDAIMFSIIFLVLGAIVGGLNLGVIGGLLLLAAHPLYCIGFWATTGQTPGYKAAGLQLIKSDGTKVGLGAAIVRYIGLSITVPLFLLGCLWMIWDYKKQALYDKMADTLVIRA